MRLIAGVVAMVVGMTGMWAGHHWAVAGAGAAGQSGVEASLSGGHDTDPRDGGRPVVLIAAALKVPADVFRKAFSGVTPAAGGKQPTREQVRRNKEALLRVLAPYGVTNDRLDEVSDYYRYNRGRGEMWRNSPAKVVATVKDGRVVFFTVENGGSGYTSPPLIRVPGFDDVRVGVELKFGDDLETNGSVGRVWVESGN